MALVVIPSARCESGKRKGEEVKRWHPESESNANRAGSHIGKIERWCARLQSTQKRMVEHRARAIDDWVGRLHHGILKAKAADALRASP